MERTRSNSHSAAGGMVARAVITVRVSGGVIFGNFHFPGEQDVSNLTIAALDPIVKIPEHNVYARKVELA